MGLYCCVPQGPHEFMREFTREFTGILRHAATARFETATGKAVHRLARVLPGMRLRQPESRNRSGDSVGGWKWSCVSVDGYELELCWLHIQGSSVPKRGSA